MNLTKEKPILFSTPMVQAILKGLKTQTRRVIKFKKPFDRADSWPYCKELPDNTFMWVDCEINSANFPEEYLKGGGTKPKYLVGNRLWVRETFATELKFNDKPMSFFDNAGDVPIWYKADLLDYKNDFIPRGKWRPSIFMPRWASRITLEVTSVRCERLQAITEKDAIAEGVEALEDRCSHIAEYLDLWDSINGKKYPWSSNPWVFVYEFKRVEGQK